MKKIIYNTIGAVSFSLGIIGVFLPLLPSTCFILLATWAFSKSSPSFHAWLYYKSPFARSIQNWQQHRVIPTKVKWIAGLSLSSSFLITLFFIKSTIIIFTLALGMFVLLIYLLSRPGKIITL